MALTLHRGYPASCILAVPWPGAATPSVQKEEEGERRKEGDGNEEAKVEMEREREGG